MFVRERERESERERVACVCERERERETRERELVSWCFKPSQPQREGIKHPVNRKSKKLLEGETGFFPSPLIGSKNPILCS